MLEQQLLDTTHWREMPRYRSRTLWPTPLHAQNMRIKMCFATDSRKSAQYFMSPSVKTSGTVQKGLAFSLILSGLKRETLHLSLGACTTSIPAIIPLASTHKVTKRTLTLWNLDACDLDFQLNFFRNGLSVRGSKYVHCHGTANKMKHIWWRNFSD